MSQRFARWRRVTQLPGAWLNLDCCLLACQQQQVSARNGAPVMMIEALLDGLKWHPCWELRSDQDERTTIGSPSAAGTESAPAIVSPRTPWLSGAPPRRCPNLFFVGAEPSCVLAALPMPPSQDGRRVTGTSIVGGWNGRSSYIKVSGRACLSRRSTAVSGVRA